MYNWSATQKPTILKTLSRVIITIRAPFMQYYPKNWLLSSSPASNFYYKLSKFKCYAHFWYTLIWFTKHQLPTLKTIGEIVRMKEWKKKQFSILKTVCGVTRVPFWQPPSHFYHFNNRINPLKDYYNIWNFLHHTSSFFL